MAVPNNTEHKHSGSDAGAAYWATFLVAVVGFVLYLQLRERDCRAVAWHREATHWEASGWSNASCTLTMPDGRVVILGADDTSP